MTPIIRDQIRPFVRAAREPIPDLNRAANKYSKAAPTLKVIASKLNNLGNMATYNPRGQEDVGTGPPAATRATSSGPAGWPTTAPASTRLQDGNGLYRRIYFTRQRLHAPEPRLRRHPGDDPLTDLGISIITGIPLDLADCS